jgi:hypothetical protein
MIMPLSALSQIDLPDAKCPQCWAMPQQKLDSTGVDIQPAE